MGLNFWGKMGAQKMKQANVAITEAMVKLDPDAATEATIAMMNEQVDKLSLEVSKAKQDWNTEQAEADAIKGQYNQRIAAAENIQLQLEDDSLSAAKRKSLDSSLNTLVDGLQDMAPDVEREVEEAGEAKEMFEEIEKSLEMAVNTLKETRGIHDKAKRDMKRAGLNAERAQKRSDQADRVAGINSGATNSMDIALKAMQDATSAKQAEADAMGRKADLMAPKESEDDKNIAAALAAVNGTTEEASKSASQRLGGLKRL